MTTPQKWTVRVSNSQDNWEDLEVVGTDVEILDDGLHFSEEYDEVVLFVPMARVIFLRQQF